MKKSIFSALCLVLLATTTQSAWGETIEINTTNSGVTGSYQDATFTVNNIQFGFTQWMKNTNIQAKKNTTHSCYNVDAIPGVITKITIVQTKTARAIKLYGGTSEKPTTQEVTAPTAGTMVFDFSTYNYTYFSMTTPDNACYITSITIEYSASQQTTVSAVPNKEAYGSVSVSGNTITATPAEGYRVSTSNPYTVTAGSATVAQSGNTFTVTPTSDCTVQINFEAISSYTVTFNYGTAGTGTTSLTGSSIALPNPTITCTGWSFAGWSTAPVSETTTAPTGLLAAGSTYAPTANTTLYAVYSKTTSGGAATWEKVTADKTNWAGTYVFTASNYILDYATSTTAGNATSYTTAGITASGNTLTGVTAQYEIIIEEVATGVYTASLNGQGYLELSSSSNTVSRAASVTGNNQKWTISWADNTAHLFSVSYNTRELQKNSSNAYMKCYTGTQTDLTWYEKVGGSTTTYATSPSDCDVCDAPEPALSIEAGETTLNLKDGKASTTLNPTGGNGGTVNYTVSPSATISGNTITFNATGTYTVTATQEKNGNTCSQQADVIITVKATPVITLVADDPPADPIVFDDPKCGGNTPLTSKKSVKLQGYNLTDHVTVTVNGDYKIARTSSTTLTNYTTSLTLDKTTEGKINADYQTIYILSTPPAAKTDATKGTLTITTKGGNTLTVNLSTPTITCTEYTLTFVDRGGTHQTVTQYAGTEVAEPTAPTGVCTDPINYVFDGWATAEVANDATTYTKVNFDTYTITGNQTFYAVYKYAGEGGSGGEEMYYLSATSSGTTYYVGEYIITENSQYLSAVTNISDAIPLGIEDGKYLYTYISGVKTYISHSTSGETTLASSTSNPKAWTITDNGTTIKLQSTAQTTRYLGYRNGFRAYTDSYTLTKTTAIQYNYTSSPACGPYVRVTAGKDVYVTAGNAGGTRSIVQVQDTVKFVAGALKGSNGNPPSIKIPAADIKIGETTTNKLTCKITQNVTDNGDGTYSISGYIVLKYKPTDFDKTEDIQVQLRAEHNTTNVNLDNFTVHARALPEKFVITAKGTDGKWYALNGDMSGSSTQPANGQLVVNATDNPTTATITPCNTLYTFDGMPNGGDLRYVRFIGTTQRYLWAAKGVNTGIQNNAKNQPTALDSAYNWLLTSADNVTYTFANQNNDRNLRLSLPRFGMYASGVNELRILPIVEADTCAYNAAPQNISLLSRTSTTLTLAWSAVPGAERYQYSDNGGADWTLCDDITDMKYPQYEITGLSAATEYTIVLRAVHGTAEKICSDTAQITVATANCDTPPTISGTIDDENSCGTLTLTATGVTATTESNTYCPVTQYGFQYTQDPTWAKYEQTEHSEALTGTINDEVIVSRGGTYYVRLYAINGVGTGYSTPVKEITVSGLANLQIITAGDATTAPMISGKATLRIGAVSDSPSPITWQVFDGSNAEQTTIAAGIANNGVFSTTAFGVYRVVAKQAANADPTYCADSATIYIEVRLPNHYGYVTNCAVLNNNNLEVINVSKDNITFGIDDADVVQIEIVKENTGNTSTGGGSQAEGLFFSKYYEATANVKLIAVFNGTGQDIDVTNYTIKYGKTSWESGYIKLGNFTNNKNIIAAGEEVILYTTTGQGLDPNIMKCVNDNYKDKPWKQVTAQNSGGSGLLSFAGDKTIALFNNTELVDVIGAVTDGGVPTNTGVVTKASQVDPSGISWADDRGWYCASGQSIKDGSVIGTSTNRCLLIRKNTVVSGANAVSSNKSTFATLCDEWVGEHVPDTAADDGVQASCDNFAYIGSFDYAEYFQRYEPVTGKIDLVDLDKNDDGSWSLPTSSFEGTAWAGKNFHDLACTSVKINGYQKINSKDSLITALNYKVPIIVDRTTTTDDAELFGFEGDGRIICPECDVVIRDNKKLSVVPAGYNNIRNMWVYSGAALNIQDAKTYNMGKLTIESENNEVGYALIKGTLNAQDGISHTKRIDANAWYDFSLPYNCKVSDIVRTNGKTLGTYGTDWIIKYYDGQKRAISGTPNGAAPTNWAIVPADGILEAGVGYIVALGGIHNANPNYKVRFVLPNRSTQPYVESVTSSVKKGVKGYTGPKAEELPCHKGWNYLGNPYVSRFDGESQTPGWDEYAGLLLNGFYTDLLTGNSYDVIEYPDLYVAVDMGEGGVTNWVQTKASEALLSPFRAFMIQAVSDGDVDFNKEARDIPQGPTLAPSIRSVGAEREIVNAVRLNISHDTYGTGSTDIMLHSLYTDKYDLGYDMVRMFNSRPAAQPFTLNSTADYLLYNAANRDLAETSDIPVGIRTLAAGTYTFSLAPLTGTDRYAAIYLIDRDENDLKIDLLQGNYTTMLARETNTSRFALRFEKGAQLPTDIDNDAIQSPIIYRDQTDIVIDNLPTDATVRVVDAIGRTLYMQQADAQIVRFHAPARGAYIIQVMTQQGNFSIKTIL